jgi:hypothetical protein
VTRWLATPVIEGRPVRLDPDHEVIEGDHKTVAGRENYIRSHGQAGVTYAVALRWPTNEGWVAADPVTVPIDTVSTTTKRGRA